MMRKPSSVRLGWTSFISGSRAEMRVA
jgi:hypothetical protein